MADGTLEAQLWEIVRNEDYGRPLPGDVLFPRMEMNMCFPAGTSTKITELGACEFAPGGVEGKTEKYAAKSKIGPSTYGCTMMSNDAYRRDGVHNFYGIGQGQPYQQGLFRERKTVRVIRFEFNLDYSFDSPVYTVGKPPPIPVSGAGEKVETLPEGTDLYTGGGGSGVAM